MIYSFRHPIRIAGEAKKNIQEQAVRSISMQKPLLEDNGIALPSAYQFMEVERLEDTAPTGKLKQLIYIATRNAGLQTIQL